MVPIMTKTMLITGGSRGIGAATAELAIERSWNVAVTFRDQTETAQALQEKLGSALRVFQVDATDSSAIAPLFDQVEAAFGPVSALVNNAGIHGGLATLAEVTEQQVSAVLNTNLTASLLYAQEFTARRQTQQAGGAIVNLSSTGAKFGGNRLVAYAAAKAGLETATIGLARELGPHGIRINCIAPGVIDTDQLKAMPEDRRKGQLATIPLGRFGTGEDVAKAILFLLSDEASYITGTTLTVHGGR
jgi:glucose 1-dehydrogenase